MSTLRAAWRLLRAVLHVLHGLWVMRRFPRLDAAARHERIRWWSAGLLRAVGMTIEVSGLPRPGATLLVANHVSWIDVAAVHAAAPHARFVSKADVLHWPLLGALIRGAGTLFIERERKRDALRVVHAMAQALAAGETVAVFPEGTTGEGPLPLPFHANLLQAAVAGGTPVQPVVLRYADAEQAYSRAVVYVGDTTLLQSIWRVVSARGLRVHVELLPPVGTRHAERRALAAHLRELVAERLP
ncbi:MAG: 1-acyl-sn-glycerol-3-phosphate acyltransferase [Burkholderiales bacterium]|nr:1-acyl-sn-glycerol-3-phosphate acyltransferase [Burkholderiales bacterium]